MTKVYAVNDEHAAAIQRAYPNVEVEVRGLPVWPRCSHCGSDAVAAIGDVQACDGCGMTSRVPAGGAL